MKWKYSRYSHLEASMFFTTESERQTDGKNLEQSTKANLATKAEKFLVCGGQNEKYRRVIIDIIPCVVITSLETDAFTAIVAYFDMLTLKRNPARVREKGPHRTVAVMRKRKGPKLCFSKFSVNELILFHGNLETWD